MPTINRIVFMGSKQLGLRVLKEIVSLAPNEVIGVVTLDDTTDARTAFSGFQAFTCRQGLDLFVAKSRKHADQLVEELKPDLCLVVGWYWLIGTKTLTRVPFGFMGIHNSLLPRYRGGSPLIWQVIWGETEVGFSLFSFTPGMDDGPVWAQGSVVVNANDYISTVLEKLENKTVQVLRSSFPRILDGSLTAREQEHDLATYCAQRFPRDGNIDWCKPARDVFNLIRAQSEPYPGAFTFWGRQEIKIWRARIFDKVHFGTPGQIARIADDGVYVICGDDCALVLEEVEVNGIRGRASDFIKSIKEVFSNRTVEGAVN